MKNIILFILFLLPATITSAQNKIDSILNVLDKVVEKRDIYFMSREIRIDSLKQCLKGTNEVHEKYDIYNRLFNEYKSYQFDSAHAYAIKVQEMALASQNDSLKVIANCNLIFSYISAGIFKDACDVVNSTNLNNIPKNIRAEFYFQCIRLFSDMSNYTDGTFTDKYAQLYHVYSDSVLDCLPPDNFYYIYASASRSTHSHSVEERIDCFSTLFHRPDIDKGWQALLSSILGDLYKEKGDLENAIYYKALASILDTESAKRETTAKKDLALYFYDKGDLTKASQYIKLALEDADFYNARHRKIEISTVLPLIEQARYYAVTNERNILFGIVTFVSLLLISLTITIFVIIKQVRKLNNAQGIIEERNEQIEKHNAQIEEQNIQLQETNKKLAESNNIKDEYIGYAFFLNSEYIGRMEDLYKFVNRKIMAKQYEDLRMSLKESDLKKERENMHTSFDSVFLKLFPSFIKSYNQLFKPEDIACPENSKMLTPEMRIFALIRLGINESSNIANFLNYSVNTVNTYKTKTKNKSIIPNEQFEQKIMEIESVS